MLSGYLAHIVVNLVAHISKYIMSTKLKVVEDLLYRAVVSCSPDPYSY
jgi:hypothetical protein